MGPSLAGHRSGHWLIFSDPFCKYNLHCDPSLGSILLFLRLGPLRNILTRCFQNHKETRTQCNMSHQMRSRSSQDTNSWRKPWYVICLCNFNTLFYTDWRNLHNWVSDQTWQDIGCWEMRERRFLHVRGQGLPSVVDQDLGVRISFSHHQGGEPGETHHLQQSTACTKPPHLAWAGAPHRG